MSVGGNGSHLTKYRPTLLPEEGNGNVDYHCISMMNYYRNKSLEELRYEDYLIEKNANNKKTNNLRRKRNPRKKMFNNPAAQTPGFNFTNPNAPNTSFTSIAPQSVPSTAPTTATGQLASNSNAVNQGFQFTPSVTAGASGFQFTSPISQATPNFNFAAGLNNPFTAQPNSITSSSGGGTTQMNPQSNLNSPILASNTNQAAPIATVNAFTPSNPATSNPIFSTPIAPPSTPSISTTTLNLTPNAQATSIFQFPTNTLAISANPVPQATTIFQTPTNPVPNTLGSVFQSPAISINSVPQSTPLSPFGTGFPTTNPVPPMTFNFTPPPLLQNPQPFTFSATPSSSGIFGVTPATINSNPTQPVVAAQSFQSPSSDTNAVFLSNHSLPSTHPSSYIYVSQYPDDKLPSDPDSRRIYDAQLLKVNAEKINESIKENQQAEVEEEKEKEGNQQQNNGIIESQLTGKEKRKQQIQNIRSYATPDPKDHDAIIQKHLLKFATIGNAKFRLFRSIKQQQRNYGNDSRNSNSNETKQQNTIRNDLLNRYEEAGNESKCSTNEFNMRYFNANGILNNNGMEYLSQRLNGIKCKKLIDAKDQEMEANFKASVNDFRLHKELSPEEKNWKKLDPNIVRECLNNTFVPRRSPQPQQKCKRIHSEGDFSEQSNFINNHNDDGETADEVDQNNNENNTFKSTSSTGNESNDFIGQGNNNNNNNIKNANSNAEVGYSYCIPTKLAKPNSSNVILTKAEYYCRPTVQELDKMAIYGKNGLCRCLVTNFEIGRNGFGKLVFMGEIDVAGINLDKSIQIQYGNVQFFFDENPKPGTGLNHPFVATFYQMFPPQTTNNSNMDDGNSNENEQSSSTSTQTEEESIQAYEQFLRKTCIKSKAEFLKYNPILGSWTFKITKLQ